MALTPSFCQKAHPEKLAVEESMKAPATVCAAEVTTEVGGEVLRGKRGGGGL